MNNINGLEKHQEEKQQAAVSHDETLNNNGFKEAPGPQVELAAGGESVAPTRSGEGNAHAAGNGNGSGKTAFARAAAFGEALTKSGCEDDELYAWEHGVAVKPWPEAVDVKQLLDALTAEIRRFAVVAKWAAEALALWIVHTYAWQLRQVATYVGIESPEKRCGKTTLLTILCEFVNRPIVAANISSPAFFRVIEEKAPTLLIDEADTVLHRNRELRGILNSGYTKKTAYVIRMRPKLRSGQAAQNGAAGEQEKEQEKEEGKDESGLQLGRFSSWCPKAIATIKHLPETLADRCIVVRMQRKTRHEKCERLRRLEGSELRSRCARFVADHAEALAGAQPEIPEDLNDRAGDIWEPLLAIADLAGGD